MLFASLLSLISEQDKFMQKFNNICPSGAVAEYLTVQKRGVSGMQISIRIGDIQEGDVSHDHRHHDSSLGKISDILKKLPITEGVRQRVTDVYSLIAEAEGQVHGTPVDQVHFHEVGALDALCDILGVCMLIDELNPGRILASPICTGYGSVCCAHGVLPVPAPATTLLLRGIPVYQGQIQGELCTPTGAALLKYFVQGFESMPLMKVESIGYGMGKKDFPATNCIRAFWGCSDNLPRKLAVEISCNLDDMTGEDIAFAIERFWEAGALDVFTAPIGMKKSRPGVLLTIICATEAQEVFTDLMLRHTSTFGLRKKEISRVVLARETRTQETQYGPVSLKTGALYDDVEKTKPEYEDLAEIARKNNLTVRQVREGLGNPQ